MSKKYYNKLIREFKNVPSPYRNIVGKALKANYAETCKLYSKEFRIWSKIHNVDEADTAVLLNVEAKKHLTEGNIKQAIIKFHEVYDYALKFPHPTFVLIGTNNVVWYLYKMKNKECLKDINILLYDCGCFFEGVSTAVNSFDTALTVLKAYKDLSYFEIAEIMLIFYNRLLKIEPGYKKRFVKTVKQTKLLSPSTLKSSSKKREVKNTYGLQVFLKGHIQKTKPFAIENGISIAALYKILRGKTENIKAETLKKVIRALELDELSFNYPRTINLVIHMMKEDESFERNWHSVTRFSAFKLKSLFLKGFMTLVSLEGIDLSALFSIAGKERENLHELIKSDPKLIAFFNRCVRYAFEPEEVNPYYRARLDLVDMLFSEMGAISHITSLMSLYASVESLEKLEQLNIYFRQYVRYSTTSWRFDVEDVLSERPFDPDYEKIARFCKKINISEVFGYLCTWEFEAEARMQLLDMFL